MNSTKLDISQEDTTKLLIEWLREPDYGAHTQYGYDIYLPSLIRTYLTKRQVDHFEIEKTLEQLSSQFYNAAWELCRRGIIRPGIATYGNQATNDGNAGNGYSITPFGQKWL